MKKKITLYSLNENEYPNVEVEVEVVENTAESIEALSAGEKFPAIKKAVVQARRARAGEVVDTRPRVEYRGRIYTFSETKRTITKEEEEKGAVVVINPDGEEYVIATSAKFFSKYAMAENGFVAIDGTKQFVRSNGNYAIQTSWGEEQIVLEGSCFCVQDKSDIYGITNTAFDGTYTTQPEQIAYVEGRMEDFRKAKAAGKLPELIS